MQDQSLLEDRLEKLLISMENLPKDAFVFYEDACFYNKDFSRIVRDKLLGHIHIFSLNEDEFEGYIGRKINLLDPFEVLQSLDVLYEIIPVPKIVLHTQYWALAYGKNAGSLKKALKGGITMGGTRYRFGDDFSRQDYFETEKSAPQKEGAQFSNQINAMKQDEIYCLPCVEVNDKNVTTIGLGDAFVGGFLPALVH
jgi:ADP-dependent phosphofructokinase/glucokinase